MSRVRTVATGVATRIPRIIGSRWFLVAVVAAYVAGAALIALAARPFLLYDEFYHFRIAELYTGQWSPWIADGSGVTGLGDVERLSSYLFHWLMSFPLRVAQAAGLGEYGQVVVLRLLCVAFSAAAIPIYRGVLRRIGLSAALANSAVAVFILPPVVMFLGATVNYDNLLLLLAAGCFALAVRAFTSERADVPAIVSVIALGSAATLVKTAFLPAFAAIGVALVVNEVVRGRAEGFRSRWSVDAAGWLRRPTTWLLLAAAFAAVVLFVERIVGNVLAYGTPDPDCARVQTEELCRTFGVWRRNEALEAAAAGNPIQLGNGLQFLIVDWLPESVRTALVVGGETARGIQTSEGSPIAQTTVGWVAVVMVFLVVLASTHALRNRAARVLAIAFATYVAALFWTNLGHFVRFDVPLAIQARYQLMFLPLLIGAAIAMFARVLDRTQRSPIAWKLAAVVVAVFLAFQGAGAITYLVGSDDSWIMPGSPVEGIVPILRRLAAFGVIGV
ncbi:glycosyltransferase family protein [Agromyces mangrovi Wang et al. 2018]|uniref:hypothetical protein n=1 Tax=Agromyces mangrovi TaxID=1858653 RepID=UPI00257265E3|nr:hypothetical protein [Agromyces mangrovi]BDZ65783.1 hypothetical protein GCM10025877_27210 [Agromyces mangrovi]